MPARWPEAADPRVDEAWAAPTRAQLVGVGVFTGYIVVARLASGEAWVPLLDGANLLFHEAGHPLVGFFSERLGVYGGTLFQLLFPALVVQHFRRRGDHIGCAVGLVWLGESLLNMARYMADARAQLLPLVGGGEHDWTEIFTRWGVLGGDRVIAAFTALLGWGLMAATWLWLLAAWRRSPHD